ncbi:MAG TPA: AMP-binding protein [Conexibacter sp.]|jgi:phenylacetate-CoA ligase
MGTAPDGTRDEWLQALERWRGTASLETRPREELRAIQSEKLRLAVAYMYEHAGLFRDRCVEAGVEPGDIRGLDDLQRLPIVSKQEMSRDLALHPPHGRFTAVDPRGWAEAGGQLFQTSGTTARPRVFRYTHLDLEVWSWLARRAIDAMGVRKGDSAIVCFGYGPHVSMWALHYAFQDLRVPVIAAGGLSTGARAELIARQRPSVLCATPSYALHLAEAVRALGADPADCGVRRLIVGGEPMPPSTQERLRRAWGAEVHQTYGCTEAAPACCAYTCEHGELHVMEDALILETVDPDTLQPVGDGQPGLTVITNLSSEASPQLRFLAGDFATLGRTEPCACGRTHRRLRGGIAGRADDMLIVRGLTLFPSAIADALHSVEGIADAFELVLTKRGELDELTIVCEPSGARGGGRSGAGEAGRGGRDDDALAATVAATVQRACELRATVELVAAGTLQRGEFKARRVRDLR